MANCVNTNTKEFKDLRRETGLSTPVLQSKVSLWQDVNGLDKFPNKEQIFSFTPMSKRLGINKKKLSGLQTSLVKKKIESYNKKNNSNVFVVFEQQGQADIYTWNITNEGIPVTTKVPVFEKETLVKRGAPRIDENLQERLFEGKEETSVQNILTTISESNHPLKELAKALSSIVGDQNIPIRLQDASILNAEGIPSTAYYNPTDKSITVADKALYPMGQAESTVLHEILHALSWSKLSVANADIIKDFENLYNYAKENSKLSETHAYYTMDEFFVAIFTNSDFIKDLKSIPASNTKTYPNVFAEILDKILSIIGLQSEDTAYEQAFNIASNILSTEVTPNPDSITEDVPVTNEEILDFFAQMDLLDLLEQPTNIEESDLIEGKTVEEYLAEDYTQEENQEIEELQDEISEMNSTIKKILAYEAELARVKEPGAILATTEFGGQVKVSFTSAAQAEDYFRARLKELEQEILEEGENAIANANIPIGVTQPNYDAYLKQKEAMLIHVEASLKNLYAQKNKVKSTKFDAKIKEFRNLQDNLISDIYDFNKPDVDKLELIERFFKQDVNTVSALLKNPTIDNYFLAKDLLDFMKKISDPTKEGDIKKGIGNTMTPYLNPKAFYPTEVLKVLEEVRTLTDKAQMLVKNAGEVVVMELLERHESKLMSIFKSQSLEEVRQELKKELSDITQVESYLFATGENIVRKNNVLDSLMRLEYEIEEDRMMAAQTVIKTEISVAEAKGVAALKAIGEDYSLFIRPGKYADKIIEKFTGNYNSFIKAIRIALDSKIYQAIKNKDWLLEQQLLTQKFNLLNNDTEFIDIGLLHEIENGSGNYTKYQLGTPAQAAAYKAQLINTIGQIEYDNIVETQRNSLDAFEQDLAGYIQYKKDQEGLTDQSKLSPESQKNITIFETRSNPLKFIENYKLNGGNMVAYSIGTQANTATAKLTYNTYIPRKVDLQGNPTDYFDTEFDKIANNPDILALYTAIRKGVYHVEDNLRGSGIFISAGDLPSFKKTITDILLEKGWKGALKQGLPTSLPEVLKVLKAVVTLKPVRTFLGKNLSGTNSEYFDDNIIETPLGISFDNQGDNKTNLATVIKAALEISAVHKARTLAKDKVRFYMEESENIKDKLGKDRKNEMARQRFFYNNVLLNKKGKKQYGDVSKALIAIDRKLSRKKFSRSRMFYKFFTAEQKEVYKLALKSWIPLNAKGLENLTKKEEETLASLENTMSNLGNDYFLSTVYQAVALKLAVSVNLISNPVAQFFNKAAGWAACRNRDGKYWPKGSFYKCNSFIHKKPMMKLVSKEWEEQAKILRIFTQRMALINDGTSELERAEGRLRQEFSVLYPMGLMKWAEDSNQTLGILCMATGHMIKDINGNEFPLFTGSKFNGYTLKDGNLELSPEFDTPENRKSLIDMNSESILDWKGDTREALNELNGDYSHTGVTRIKGHVLTAPLMLYKTWLPKYLSSRWKVAQKNVKKGTVEKGFMLEAITGKTSGSSGIMLGSTVAIGALVLSNPAIPLTIGAALAGIGVVNNIVRSVTNREASLIDDEDEMVVTWKKQVNFVLQTVLRTPATPINMLAGRQIIKTGEDALGLNESKLNEKISALAARDIARNLQYSLAIVAFNLAIQAAFGPPDEEEEKKGEEGSAQRKRWEAQQERKKIEHPYYNFAVNVSERLLQETNTCLDITILATTFGSKNTLEGSYDKLGKALEAWLRPEEEDIIKTGKNMGQSKTSQFLRGALLPATVRQVGAEGGFKKPLKGWRMGAESITETERSKKSWAKDYLRTTDFKKASTKYKAEMAIKLPIALDNVLQSWKYESVEDIPVATMTLFKKQVKIEAAKLIREENLTKDLEDKVFVPKRTKFDKDQMKKPKKEE
jgi:hypothetical protein